MSAYAELQAWRNGTANGGPFGDGRYPLTNAQGQVFYLLCPAADQAANEDLAVQPEIFAVEAGEARDAAVAAQTAAETAATSATGSASTATAKATAASDSAAAAATSASTATTKATAASNSATAAAGSASTATTKASEASASANAASTSAADAADSATEAYSWAMTAQTSVTGLLHYAGAFDASTGTFPTGMAKGAFYKITKAGTVSGVDLAVGDQIIFADPGWDKIDNTESVTSVANRVGAVTLSIPDISGLQGALDNRALIGGTPQFSDVRIGADSDVLLYEGAANQLNLRVGPSTAYKYFSFSANGDFTASNGDVTSKDLRTDRGDGTGAVWFGGAGDGYLYRSGVGSFQLRAGTSFFDLTAPGTILTTGNFNPSSYAALSGATFTGRGTFSNPGTAGGMATSTGSLGCLWAYNSAQPGAAAFMTFHRSGSYACYFGLDTDNKLKVGGWSMGDVAYEMWHAGNFNPATKANANNAAFTGTMTLPTGAGTCTIAPGTGDGASYTTYNFKISSWWGIGFASYDGSINGFYDARAGRWDTKGGYRVNGQDVWHAGNFTPGTAALKNTGDFAASTTYGGGDLNTLLTSGVYRLNNNVTNGPTGSLWGQLLVLHGGGDTQAQQYFPYASSDVYTRGGSSSGAAWQPWVKHWHSGNLDPASFATAANPSLSGTATITGAEVAYQLSATGQRSVKFLSTQTPRVGIYDATNSQWMLRFELDNKAYFPTSIYAGSQEVHHDGNTKRVYVQSTDPGAVPDGSLWVW